ncbi:MAG: putative porin [Vicingaceae bacterium]|nr:putative porin [Vicingaceae bacterium]
MRQYLIILYIIFTFCFSSIIVGQNNDTLVLNNAVFDSIIHSEHNDINTLFYKHTNDVLVNNLGVFPSTSYFPTSYGIISHSLIPEKHYEKMIDIDGVKPLSRITYINASRREQIFSLKHQNNFGKGIEFFVDIDKMSSPGVYINQEVSTSNFNSMLRYKSKSDKYAVSFAGEYFRKKQQENGGLVDRVQFEENLAEDPLSIGVNLFNSNYQFTNYTYKLAQRIDLISFNQQRLYFFLSNSYAINENLYSDNDVLSPIFNTIRLDSITWLDSISYHTIANKGGIGIRNKKYDFGVFTVHEYNTYFQTSGLDTNYNNIFSGAQFTYKNQRLKVEAEGKYGVSGYRQNDLLVMANASYLSKKDILLKLNLFSQQEEADLKYVNFSSNHFSWQNYSLKKQLVNGVNASVNFQKYRLELSANSRMMGNYIYFDEQVNLTQSNKQDLLNTFSLAKNYSLYKFHFRTAVIYQTTSDKYLFPLPDFIWRQLVYFQTNAFKKAVKLQIGFNVSYKTGFYGYAYMPEIAQFYVQKEQKIGEYPYVDVFLNMHVKRAQVFLKYEHFNAGWNSYDFYATANYPALGRSLKFGIVWNLVD